MNVAIFEMVLTFTFMVTSVGLKIWAHRKFVREIYRNKFKYEGNRSIVFSENDDVPVKELGHCISLALTYHLNKRSGNRV